MNNTRRNKLKNIIELLKNVASKIDSINNEEQEYLDNMPENLQTSEKYAKSEEICDQLADCYDQIDGIIDIINEIINT